MDVVKVDMQGVDVTEEDAGRLGGLLWQPLQGSSEEEEEEELQLFILSRQKLSS